MNSTILFIPMILIFEMQTIIQNIESFKSFVFWLVMNLAGILGFFIGIVTIAQISLTSPLTHNIAGTAKACVQTIIAVLFLGDRMTFRSILGTGCVLFGTFMYSLVRNYEMDKKKRASPRIDVLVQRDQGDSDDLEDKPLLVKRETN